MLSDMPLLTVLMPVFNGAKYLRQSIESILLQTEASFEFLIIDDGSTDSSAEVISSYRDSRIRFIRNDANLGLVSTLNKGLRLSRGKFIARMDADDISLFCRLKIQVDFMIAHPEIGICGGEMLTFGEFPSERWRVPTEPQTIYARLFFQNTIAHSSVMIRKEWIEKFDLFYDDRFKYCEDWWFWWRASRHFPISNLPQVLVLYRKHKENLSTKFVQSQLASESALRKQMREDLGWPAVTEGMPLEMTESLLLEYASRNRDEAFFDQAAFERALSEEWFNRATLFSYLGMSAWRRWRNSKLRFDSTPVFAQMKFFSLCFFGLNISSVQWVVKIFRTRPHVEFRKILLLLSIRLKLGRSRSTL